MNDIVFKELSYRINGICFKVHRDIGRFGREIQYADKLEDLFKGNEINFKREFEIKDLQNNKKTGNRPDFIIEDRILLDVKAKKFITKEDYYQMQRYLKSANIRLGMIVNFRNTYLKPKRVLNSKAKDNDIKRNKL
ncbi:hypothetical protein A2159_01700 [Candidatus Woesebacteria bacterium RBG_13_34_9]|uniref:GxxExxY protein n=1 Tax=Candidatus Woesebacteria bacterium RBG_13_34_9 TaxID=1802477 RepID=A0A1F7X439_9BACT|nr:MAG: hypothetical protein A2159_01700 [Candidatus Woesebacteria bacterium RBG_13_34_9]